jgi:signal transduction histidine kinase/AmiR/NasT family two-component response regulator
MGQAKQSSKFAPAPAPAGARWRQPPLLLLFALNLAAGLCLALGGAPALAAVWTAASCAGDWVLRRRYGQWLEAASPPANDVELRALTLAATLRSSLWVSAPLLSTVLEKSAASAACGGLVTMGLFAVATVVVRTSRPLCAAILAPAAAAIAIQAAVHLGGEPALGVVLGIAALAVLLVTISRGAQASAAELGRANERTLAMVADLKAALARSAAAEHRLRVAVKIANLFVYEVDYAAGTLVTQGDSTRFFEEPLTFERVLSDPFFGAAPDDCDGPDQAWARYDDGGQSYRTEYKMPRADGADVWAFGAAELARGDDGDWLTLVGALHDITERKHNELDLITALERAEAGSRAKSDFLAVMSHEIRTPLNGVLGMAQAMLGENLPPLQRERLEVIRTSGETLLVMLDGLLDLAKIESGKMVIEAGELDAEDLARAALATFATLARDKDLAMTVEVTPRAHGVYAGDPIRVGQILFNLISNAVKFTHSGSVCVSIDRVGHMLRISVADTGIGVSPAQQAMLFEKFVQADASITRKYGGSGLGLALARNLARLMDGDIHLESVEGIGSTFTVALGLRWLKASAPAAQPIRSLAQPPAGTPTVRVLAAEDNPTNQLVLKALLAPAGLAPTMVDNGLQAVDAWEAGAWDLVLMDVQMPVMDGLAAVRHIREIELRTGRARTPIIALTANVMSHQVASYRAAGMDEVVAKPIEVARLYAAMEACLAAAEERALPDASRPADRRSA